MPKPKSNNPNAVTYPRVKLAAPGPDSKTIMVETLPPPCRTKITYGPGQSMYTGQAPGASTDDGPAAESLNDEAGRAYAARVAERGTRMRALHEQMRSGDPAKAEAARVAYDALMEEGVKDDAAETARSWDLAGKDEDEKPAASEENHDADTSQATHVQDQFPHYDPDDPDLWSIKEPSKLWMCCTTLKLSFGLTRTVRQLQKAHDKEVARIAKLESQLADRAAKRGPKLEKLQDEMKSDNPKKAEKARIAFDKEMAQAAEDEQIEMELMADKNVS